jgi:hypothetical protein
MVAYFSYTLKLVPPFLSMAQSLHDERMFPQSSWQFFLARSSCAIALRCYDADDWGDARKLARKFHDGQS